MRSTKQKQILQECVVAFNSFFNAEELHAKIKKDNPKIGIATIYRFLKNLESQREVHSYTCDRRTIYSISNKNHCHFVCERCGVTKHITVKNLDFLSHTQDKVCHIQIDVSGICKECISKIN